MRVLVCGGREYRDQERLHHVLDEFHASWSISLLVHGAAHGADTLAGHWAAAHNIPMKSFPADWGKHGRAAGSIRNQQMLDEEKPEAVIAFPGGNGTGDMISRAKKAGVPVIEIGA